MNLFKSCKNGNHKLEARYSYGQPTILKVGRAYTRDYISVLEATKSKTYIHDICVKCGKIVK